MPLPVPGRIAEALRRSTVRIRSGRDVREGHGSGVVLASEQVVTNAHVVQSRQLIIESWEGKSIAASLVKEDRRRDLALLTAPGLAGTPAILGDSGRLRPGTPVVAVGNPFGFVGALSSGAVHQIGPFQPDIANLGQEDWVCSDLRLAPGNSGGPLANFQAEVVGINTMIAAGGLAFAIPSRTLQSFLNRKTPPASLGVTVRPVRLGSGNTGLLILELAPGGAAESASLLQGDVLVAANGTPFRSQQDLLVAIDEAADSLLEVSFVRSGRAVRRVHVKLLPVHLQHAA
jgi:serine protease Do